MLDRAVELLEDPYDDRDLRDPGAPSITFVAHALHTTLIRTRKLLITADYYSTVASRRVQALAKSGRMFKKRKQACEQLVEHLEQPDAVIYMWSAVLAFQGYPFTTPKGYPFKYKVKNWEMHFSQQENSLNKTTVELAFYIARDLQKKEGCVSSAKKLATIGASYLYPIFLRIGVCEKKPEPGNSEPAGTK